VTVLRRRELLRNAAGLIGFAACAEELPQAEPRPDAPFSLSKQPYVQRVGPRAVRLRFETRLEEALRVRLFRARGELDLQPTLSPAELQFSRELFDESDDYLPDHPGLHVLQEVVVDDLELGEEVSWEVHADLGWISDTSWPLSLPSAAVLAAQAPGVLLHGGDLQYQTSPLDTWRGMSRSLAPLTSEALAHFIVGNHEFEDGDEIHQMYDRLYRGQGDGAPDSRHFAFGYGGLRLLCLDSESGEVGEPSDPQWSWLDGELALAAADADVRQVIIALHRPTYTLSKHVPSSTAVRDALHSRLLDRGVKLVLAGHAHCYERFEVDGVTYVVDGGGGALLYDPNEGLEEADELRPGESALRSASERSHGVCVVDLAAGGTLSVTRFDQDGRVTDRVDID
jgi:hypothetical protein